MFVTGELGRSPGDDVVDDPADPGQEQAEGDEVQDPADRPEQALALGGASGRRPPR